jgi:hypothetical protein
MHWSRTYGGSNFDWGYSVQQTIDGGYAIAGTTYSGGAGGRVWLIRTDPNGDTLWTRAFERGSYDEGRSVRQTADSGCIVAGFTERTGSGADVLLIKTDANGDTVWTRTFGGKNGEQGNCVQQTWDGGYIITGFTMSYGAGRDDVWLVKTGPNGEVDEGGGK